MIDKNKMPIMFLRIYCKLFTKKSLRKRKEDEKFWNYD